MIELPGEEGKLGSLRLEVQGVWTVAEFQSLLFTINDTYQRIAPVMLLGELVLNEERSNARLSPSKTDARQDWTWRGLYYGSHFYYSNGPAFLSKRPTPEILAAVLPFVVPLGIDAVKLESRGWVQVIGNLNPLKVIADFISKWRAENTKRLSIHTTAETARERIRTEAAVERERMRKGFALEILRQLPSADHGAAVDRLPEIVEHAIAPTLDSLERMSADVRIDKAEIVNAGSSLPQVRKRRTRASDGPKETH